MSPELLGPEAALVTDRVMVDRVVWAGEPVAGPVGAQCSAHGAVRAAVVGRPAGDGESRLEVRFAEPQRRVAAGQSVVFYEGDEVAGGGIVTS